MNPPGRSLQVWIWASETKSKRRDSAWAAWRISPVASSYSAPVALEKTASIDEYLSHDIRSVYQVSAEGDAVAPLMAELKKVRSVIDKHGAGLPLESMLVIDASTGQNGLQQAKVFMEACPLTGVILTKLDGSAKGGIVFSITRDLKIPVKLFVNSF